MWYVVQISTGKEERVRLLTEAMLPKDIFVECNIPRYIMKKKYGGAWHMEEHVMFPGYLFIVTENPKEVFLKLKEVPALTKLMRTDDYIIPVSTNEQFFLERLCGKERVADMSYGFIENDAISITSGPLVGMEGVVKKIDRHKRLAWIEQVMFGEKRLIRVGLEILEKR